MWVISNKKKLLQICCTKKLDIFVRNFRKYLQSIFPKFCEHTLDNLLDISLRDAPRDSPRYIPERCPAEILLDISLIDVQSRFSTMIIPVSEVQMGVKQTLYITLFQNLRRK